MPKLTPLKDVEVSVLTDKPNGPGSVEKGVFAPEEAHQDNLDEVARLLEESSRLLQGIK